MLTPSNTNIDEKFPNQMAKKILASTLIDRWRIQAERPTSETHLSHELFGKFRKSQIIYMYSCCTRTILTATGTPQTQLLYTGIQLTIR